MKPADEKELRKDLTIDEYNLQEEFVNQPNLYMKYGDMLSKYIEKKDLRKRAIARKYLKKKEKISDAALTRIIDCDKEIIALTYQINWHKHAVIAITHKKGALENEAQLLQGGFFAEPRTKKKRKGGK